MRIEIQWAEQRHMNIRRFPTTDEGQREASRLVTILKGMGIEPRVNLTEK